jgi:hypothetical protein
LLGGLLAKGNTIMADETYLSDWFDAVDHSPRLVCEVELSNGNRLDAIQVMGGWEDLYGSAVYPVRFRLKLATVITPLYHPGWDGWDYGGGIEDPRY